MRALIYAGLFAAAVASAVIWVLWSRGIEERRVGLVVISEGLLTLIGLWTFTSVVSDRCAAIPTICGAMVGAFIGMKLPVKSSES